MERDRMDRLSRLRNVTVLKIRETGISKITIDDYLYVYFSLFSGKSILYNYGSRLLTKSHSRGEKRFT